MTDKQRITDLEARIAQLEARLAQQEARPVVQYWIVGNSPPYPYPYRQPYLQPYSPTYPYTITCGGGLTGQTSQVSGTSVSWNNLGNATSSDQE